MTREAMVMLSPTKRLLETRKNIYLNIHRGNLTSTTFNRHQQNAYVAIVFKGFQGLVAVSHRLLSVIL